MRELTTARLTLIPQQADHAEAMFGVLADPLIYQYENEPPASLEALRERYARLESRCSPDGSEHWLNWVLRLHAGDLIGFVQATVGPRPGHAWVAYELASAWWGHGLAQEAVRAMLHELAVAHGVREFSAVLKQANLRSVRLLQRLGFSPARPEDEGSTIDPDECLMRRGPLGNPAADPD